jgi:hypothetical protein
MVHNPYREGTRIMLAGRKRYRPSRDFIAVD